MDGRGLVDGQGARWWGVPGVGYLVRAENRPKLLVLAGSTRALVENLYLKDSPYWTFWAPGSLDLEVCRCVPVPPRVSVHLSSGAWLAGR